MFIKKIIEKRIGNYKTFNKNEIIFHENDVCEHIGIVVDGSVSIKNIFSNGNEILIKRIKEEETFGEHLIFSSYNRYPASIISDNDNAKILFISKNSLIKLLNTDVELLYQFINHLSDYSIQLNNRLKTLSKRSIREKITYYIYLNTIAKNSYNFKITILEDIASTINCDRVSFSREFNKLIKEGIIEYNKKTISVLDIESLINNIK
jgi:CRP-like cAMP-binding protein